MGANLSAQNPPQPQTSIELQSIFPASNYIDSHLDDDLQSLTSPLNTSSDEDDDSVEHPEEEEISMTLSGKISHQQKLRNSLSSVIREPPRPIPNQTKIVYPTSDPFNRSMYVGDLVDGKREGKGTLEWKNGDRYRGEWKNNTFHGYGVLIWSDGMKYFGEWENGQFHGNGTLEWRNGKKYEGRWKNCKHDGMGIMTYGKEDGRNRNTYEGEWEDGKRHGEGVMKWNNGASYSGNWNSGKREGFGEHIFPTGERYIGEWKNGKREGKGTRIFANSDTYEGSWVLDKKDGPGVFIQAHGRRVNQEWENGKLKPIENTIQEPQSLFVIAVESIAKSSATNEEIEMLPIDMREPILICRKNQESSSELAKVVRDSVLGRILWKVFSPPAQQKSSP